MKSISLMLLLVSVIMFSGCALMQQLFPSQKDANGNPIAATHAPNAPLQAAGGYVPYLAVVSAIVGGVWNFAELVKGYKNGVGLKSTVQAIEQAGKDPKTAEAIAEIKKKLSAAHQIAGVQPTINDILAKL